jgi:hypothetical protein
MNSHFQKPVIYLLLCFLITGCTKEGCMDSNSANYNPKANKNDGLCTYRYLNLVIVHKIPQITLEEAIYGYSNPNLKFYMKMSEEIYWEVETPIARNNSIYPYSWKIDITNNSHLFWNKAYDFLLSNENFTGMDTVFGGTFIPSQAYYDDKIILVNPAGTAEIELDFVVY